MTRERQRLRILYEDQIGAVPRFPLHRLVIAAANDLCAIERWRLEQRVIAIPKKGRDRVLEELSRAQTHLNDGACLLAWLDDDRVRDAFPNASQLTHAATIELVKARAGTHSPGRIEAFLLDKNLESLLQALRSELVDAFDATFMDKAITKKRLDSRDQCLLHIASSPWLRELLRQRHQGFDCVTRYVAAIATIEPWPFH